MRYGLGDKIIAQINGVLAQNGHIQQAILYGSRALGTYRPGSDIDLALLGEQLTTADLLALHSALDDLLLPYTFDLAILHDIDNPDLLDHIRRVGKVFFPPQ